MLLIVPSNTSRTEFHFPLIRTVHNVYIPIRSVYLQFYWGDETKMYTYICIRFVDHAPYSEQQTTVAEDIYVNLFFFFSLPLFVISFSAP